MNRDWAEEVASLTEKLGSRLALRLSGLLAEIEPGSWAARKKSLLNMPSEPELRLRLEAMLEEGFALGLDAKTQAMVMRASALVCEKVLNRRSLELVWSGPDSRKPPSRLTRQAMLEVIENARENLLIVAYTMHRIKSLHEALLLALERGVRLTLVIEDLSHTGDMSLGALRKLSAKSSFRRYYVWPREEKHPDGVVNLHVKCLVADGRKMLVGSANVTKAAMERNMELGVLITGGPEPKEVSRHFEWLIRDGVLQPRTLEVEQT